MVLPDRQSTLRALTADPAIDVLIVGGGINGAGVLRELALNGVNALLVDKADFAAGATAASSRMIHGGLRYLENGELRLVHESLRERDRLLALAPHAVRPLATTIPIFSFWSGLGNSIRRLFGIGAAPSSRGALIIKVGLTFYDLLTARRRRLPTHHFTARNKALRLRPLLHPGICCTATYHDAQVELPERLCLEIIADAYKTHSGSKALNYCSLERRDGPAVVLLDGVTKREYRVEPRVVVNATGGWIDFAHAALGQSTRWIGGTKGSHLIIDHPELLEACRGEQLFYENADGRVCIFFPVNGRVLVGSTDIRIDHPDQAVCEPSEIDYMIESVRTVFPEIRLSHDHIMAHFCGVRPLPSSEEGFTGQISRDHSCRTLPPAPDRPWPVHAMIGGKWTTFRAFAADVTDRALSDLGRKRRVSSELLPIPGQGQPDVHNETALQLIIQNEAVVHLDDLLLRRTPLALFTKLSHKDISTLAQLMAKLLAWDGDQIDSEISRTRRILETRHGIKLTP